MRRLLLVVILATAAIATAAALALAAADRTPRAHGSHDLQVTCRSAPFPATHLNDRATAERGNDPLSRALRHVLSHEHSPMGAHYPKTGWLLFSRSAATATFGHRSRGTHGYGYLLLARKNGRWGWAGEGGCTPERVVPDAPAGLAAAQRWRVVGPVTSSATTLPIEIEMGACVGQHAREDRFDHARVHVTPTRVNVLVLIRPLAERGLCLGVGITRHATIHLRAPLGHRRIYDLRTYPATRVAPGPSMIPPGPG